MEDKIEFRKKAREIRRAFTNKEEASDTICAELMESEEIREAKTVAVYCATEDEVQTGRLIERLLKDNKRVAVPLIRDGQMYFQEIRSLADLKTTGTYGIREPLYAEKDIVEGDELDVAIFPGLAFDLYRNRLGHGGGYYDAYFRDLKEVRKIAVAYDVQIFAEIPHDKNDLKADLIITENRII